MGYTLTQSTFRNLKSRLTRAINSGDPLKVQRECLHAWRIFEAQGYPDAWHRWKAADDDAAFALLRAGTMPQHAVERGLRADWR